MMQAIVTRYHGPSNVRGSRISATAAAGRVYLGCDDALSIEANHKAAAEKLCVKFQWPTELIGGGLPTGDMVWVFKE